MDVVVHFDSPRTVFDLIFLQPVLQIAQAGAALISLVEFAHDFCLFWYDAEFAICIFFVSIEPVARDFQCSDLCVHLLAAPDVAGDGFTFGLRHRAVHRDHKFAVGWQRVDILFLEEDPNAKLPEDARIIDAVERVAGKSLDGLCKDEVDLFLLALTDHAQEFRALFRGRAGDALVRENASHCPFLVGHDFVGIVFALGFVAAGLFFFLGRDAAVRRDAKLLCDRSRLLQFWLGWNDNDARLFVCHTKSSFPMICPFLSCKRTAWRVTSTAETALCSSSALSSAVHSKA